MISMELISAWIASISLTGNGYATRDDSSSKLLLWQGWYIADWSSISNHGLNTHFWLLFAKQGLVRNWQMGKSTKEKATIAKTETQSNYYTIRQFDLRDYNVGIVLYAMYTCNKYNAKDCLCGRCRKHFIRGRLTNQRHFFMIYTLILEMTS